MTQPQSSGNLGRRYAEGVLTTKNLLAPLTNLWQVTFAPQDMPQSSYEVWHGAIRGPGGYFLVYLDDSLFGVGENGTINEYVPSIPMFVRPGQIITLNWSIATGTKPQAWLYVRTPEVGRT